MRVKDILYKCDSNVKVAVVDTICDMYMLTPDYVGFHLTKNHWVLDEQVSEIHIKDNVLVLCVEVE